MQQLSKNVELQGGKYRIEKVLGQGGFGITYLANQTILGRNVAIKEFFFKDLCERDQYRVIVNTNTSTTIDMVARFKEKFLKEAKTISRLHHENIVSIYDVFEENDTAYYVMEYVEGYSLEQLVQCNGALSEDKAVQYIKQIANALDYIHGQRINHLDVKPANIMIRESDNKAVLIDFGVSKQYDLQGGQTSTTPVGISYGYAPMEQYTPGGVSEFSPQTDIYALGATLFRLVTGMIPPQVNDIINNGLPPLPSSLSLNVKNLISNSMQIKKADRPQNIKEFIGCLIEIARPQNNAFSNEETVILNSQDKPQETKDDLRRRADSIKKKYEKDVHWTIWLAVFLSFIPIFLSLLFSVTDHLTSTLIYSIFWVPFLGWTIILFCTEIYIKIKCNQWKKEHSNDPVCNYIKSTGFWIKYNNKKLIKIS